MKRLLFLAAALPLATPLYAQDIVNPGPLLVGLGSSLTNMLVQLDAEVLQLVTAYGGLFTRFGMAIAASLSVILLLNVLGKFLLLRMSGGGSILPFADLGEALFRIFVVMVLLQTYLTPILGTGWSVASFFPRVGTALAATVDMSGLDRFLTFLGTIMSASGTQRPAFWDDFGAQAYLFLLVALAFLEGIILLILSIGYIFIGVGVLAGPFMIPFYLTKSFNHVFWNWVNFMIEYSLYKFTVAAVFFVLCNFLLGFFVNAFNGDYSIGHLIGLLLTVISVCIGFAFLLFKIPTLNARLFGGAGSGLEAISNGIIGSIRLLTARAALALL